tara:strand:- start:296 stop:499 length:204 start_codon:yes stop_codon:yes gene_type:complete
MPRNMNGVRPQHPKFNDVDYLKSLLDEVMDWELIDNEIEECEQAGAMAPKGRLSSLIILKNKINEVR